jgi:hypothetical protein
MPSKQSGPPSPLLWRTFSGHWMFFYFGSFAMHFVNAKYGGLSSAKVQQKILKIFDN